MRAVVVAATALAALSVATAACADDRGEPQGRAAVTPVPGLTLRQEIGQRFVYPFSGTRPPKPLVRRIRRGEAAGVILFGRNVRSVGQVRRLTRDLQAIPRPRGLTAPLLVMVDQEGGAVRRIPGAPARPAAQMSDPAAQGAATAKLLRAAGVNVDLAPVVDIARPGGAIAREQRAFGTSAAAVIRRAGAFAAALAQGGVAPGLKHYPGFGAATVNTDAAPARIQSTLADMREADLVPFQQIAAPLIMSSTAVYPAVDPRPASFSHRWITEELRGRIGFDGVVVTDDLQTPAVAGFGSPSQLAFFALSAGVDIPLFAKTYGTAARAADGLTRAVKQGRLKRADVRAGALRVLALRTSMARGHYSRP